MRKNRRKMMRRFKNQGFLWFKKLKKTKNWRCKKRPQKFKKKKKSKTLVLRRKEKWNKKRHVFLKEKMKKTNRKS